MGEHDNCNSKCNGAMLL